MCVDVYMGIVKKSISNEVNLSMISRKYSFQEPPVTYCRLVEQLFQFIEKVKMIEVV